MAPKSSGRSTTTKRKRRGASHSKAKRAAGVKARSPVSRALQAHSDLIRKQDLRERGVQRNAHRLPNLEMLDLMGRTLSAFMGLPLRMARCRTPLDAWNEQNQLLRSIADDCQSVAFRMMTAGFVPLPQSRPRLRGKNR